MIRTSRFYTYQLAKRAISHLFPLHYAELGDGDLYKLRPNDDLYTALAESGNLIMILAYVQECVGYTFTVLNHEALHDEGTSIAQNDLLFVHPNHRNGRVGKMLMDRTREVCKDEGADALIWTAKDGTPLDRILKKRMPLLEHTYIDKLT